MTADLASVPLQGFLARLAWHVQLAARASRFGILVALAGGFALPIVLIVQGGWLAGAVAAGAAVASLACIAAARHPLDPTVAALGPEVAMEKVGAADQVAHGLARAAFVLGALFLGLQAAVALGLGRA